MSEIRSDAPSLRESPKLQLRQRLALFANEVICSSWDGDLDGADIQDLAEKYGLIREVAFDPRRHADNYGVGASRGDPWFTRAGGLTRAVRLARAELGNRKDGASLQIGATHD